MQGSLPHLNVSEGLWDGNHLDNILKPHNEHWENEDVMKMKMIYLTCLSVELDRTTENRIFNPLFTSSDKKLMTCRKGDKNNLSEGGMNTH